MSLRRQSESGLFLMELLINLLLFCLLCGCALLFFIKSHHLSEDATMLNKAVQITSSLAGIYETDKDGLEGITRVYPQSYADGNSIILYLDSQYQPCEKAHSYCYISVVYADSLTNSVDICFYDHENLPLYSIRACKYIPATPQTWKEVVAP